MAMTVDERQAAPQGQAVAAAETGPMRMCVGCRARHAQAQLLRFGLQPRADQQPARVAPTLGGRRSLGGRSAYLCPRRECLERAIKRRVFTRALSAGSVTGRAARVSPSSESSGSIEAVGPAAADALWAAQTDTLRREIDLLGRCAENTHAHLRRRGLERLLFELSSQPAPSDGRSANRQGGTPTHG